MSAITINQTAADQPAADQPASGAGAAKPIRLPPLREDLTLVPGPRTPEGAPSWTLCDPATNRFFRIGWAEFEMLARWGLGDTASVARAVADGTTLTVTAAEVEAFARFLWAHSLLHVQGEEAVGRLMQTAAARRPHWVMWLLKNYLFFRVPLVRPDHLLARLRPLADVLFGRAFLALTVLAGAAGVVLVARRWDAFLTTFPHLFSLEGAAVAALALLGAKIAHELGHAFAAHRYGCRVATMGVAVMVMWPVLYTDTSDAWRLTSRRQRLVIGSAGMAAELMLAAWATLAWSFLPDGPFRTAAFLLATSTWILTLLVNLNPLMRFDGYYLLSDWLDVANLQDRSFALARWRLREGLFGLGDPPPECLASRTRRVMLIYAYATWIYRFFLFLGIALLVYHLFFKALGLALMVVEVWWFIARPIASELAEWVKRRDRVRVNRRSLTTLVLLAGGLAALFVPWSGSVSAPAVLRAEQQTRLFAPHAGRLAVVAARPGEAVEEGALLFRLEAGDLAFERAQSERKAETLRARIEAQTLSRDLAERAQSSWRELEAERARAAGLAAELRRLDVAAPFSGVVVDMAEPLAPGDWLAEGEPLATLVDPRSGLIEAYVAEDDLARVAEGAAARFLADDPGRPPVSAAVTAIAQASSRVLNEPGLASVHGGAIPTRHGADGALIPETPVYRVLLRPERAAPGQVVHGTVHVDGAAESVAVRLLRAVIAVLVRESGF